MSKNNIQYRNIKGFPGYRIGSDGSIWSCLKRTGSKKHQRNYSDEWHEYSLAKDKDGYPKVMLRDELQKRYFFRVHTLVLENFVCPKPEGMVCRHFPDKDRSNNNLSNLSWGTPEENTQDMYIHETTPKGSKNYFATLTEVQVKEIKKELQNKISCSELAIKYNVQVACISKIKLGRTWKHV